MARPRQPVTRLAAGVRGAREEASIFDALCRQQVELRRLDPRQQERVALWILRRNIAEGALDAAHVIEVELQEVRRGRPQTSSPLTPNARGVDRSHEPTS